jgi:DNA invertase Pin-like site-specific DNA recombinase
MKIGYARSDVGAYTLDYQLACLSNAGCDRIFSDPHTPGNGLDAAPGGVVSGDMFLVCKLDRLGYSLVKLLDALKSLADRKVLFASLYESIDTGPRCDKVMHRDAGRTH